MVKWLLNRDKLRIYRKQIQYQLSFGTLDL